LTTRVTGNRLLHLCMSKNSLGSDWVMLESQTYRFTDPVNRENRFIPLRLDDTEPRTSLRQFAYVNWRREGDGTAYAACSMHAKAGRKPKSYTIDTRRC
jgi:hypothetical protein